MRIAFCFVASLLLTGCTTATTPSTVDELLTSAATYLGSSVPNFENTVGSYYLASDSSPTRSTNFITPAVWSSAVSGELISPPGGAVSDPSEEPTFGGVELPVTVNYRDYMKMSLDDTFMRTHDSRTFRPTIFGRFDSLVQILEYVRNSGITTDADGLPAVGSYNTTITVDSTTLRIIAVVANTTTTTYYDRTMDVLGFVDTNANQALDTGETTVFQNLIWLRANSTTLNFMQVELADRDSNSSNDTGTFSVLKWNRSTGAFQFEYVSNPSDSISNGNLEIYRAHIEGTGGKGWLYGFQGKADATAVPGDYMQWALYTPTTSSTEGTVSLREVRSNADIWLGNLCSIFTSGVGSAGDTAGDAEPASGGTCAGQVADAINTKAAIMTAAFSLRADTVWTETADDKGFPATANPSFSTEESRLAWLTAGESVSVSFDSRTEFLGQWDATP